MYYEINADKENKRRKDEKDEGEERKRVPNGAGGEGREQEEKNEKKRRRKRARSVMSYGSRVWGVGRIRNGGGSAAAAAAAAAVAASCVFSYTSRAELDSPQRSQACVLSAFFSNPYREPSGGPGAHDRQGARGNLKARGEGGEERAAGKEKKTPSVCVGDHVDARAGHWYWPTDGCCCEANPYCPYIRTWEIFTGRRWIPGTVEVASSEAKLPRRPS